MLRFREKPIFFFKSSPSIFSIFEKIRLETPEIAVFREKHLEERVVKDAWPSATTHSTDHSSELGSSV